MQLFPYRLAALLLLALVLPALALAQEPASPPQEVMEAIAGSPVPKPEQVIVGTYVNDIQQLDFKTNNYVIDLYVWFRWRSPDIDPSKSMEFMNRYASDDNRRDVLTRNVSLRSPKDAELAAHFRIF